MLNQENTINKPTVTVWQIVMLFLCVYVLIALFVETVFRLPPDTSDLLNRVDNLVCIVFIADFVRNLVTAKSKLGYLKWGWIDFVSSIPYLYFLRWGRLVRVVRIMRLLRGVRSTKLILQLLFANRAKGTFATVAMITFVLVVFASIAVLNFENTPESNIKNAPDALWWAFVTVSTVGYGDRFPVTHLGRIVAVLLMTAGVGLFGTFTAYVASLFNQQEAKEDEKRDDAVIAELKAISERLDRMEKRTEQAGGLPSALPSREARLNRVAGD
ncbi:MAG: ion transporter [Kiritimatiellia bacterium]|jgi:voltage-gated potassium channel|nr:ion transporter [Kiritimatiellia bacterium]